EAVAKPETYGLAPGWSGALMGMMTLVRVLPPDKYEEVMTKVREGRKEKPSQSQPAHKHGGEPARPFCRGKPTLYPLYWYASLPMLPSFTSPKSSNSPKYKVLKRVETVRCTAADQMARKPRGRTAMKKYNLAITTAAALLCWAAVGITALAQHEGHGGQKPPTQDNRQQPEMQRQVGQMETSMTGPNHLLAMAYLQNMAKFTRLLRDQVQQDNSVDGDFARDVTAEIRRSFDQVERYDQEQMDMTQGGMRMSAMRDHSSMPANTPSAYRALREIGAVRGTITPPSPAVQDKTNTQTGDQSDGQLRSQADGQMNNRMTGQMTVQTAEMMRQMEACLTQLSAHLIELERETGAANPNPKWVLEHTNAILRLLDEMSTMRSGGNAGR